MTGAVGLWTRASRSFGPYVYLETRRFMFHAWARRFGLPWHRGYGARVMLRVGDRRYVRGWGISGGMYRKVTDARES